MLEEDIKGLTAWYVVAVRKRHPDVIDHLEEEWGREDLPEGFPARPEVQHFCQNVKHGSGWGEIEYDKLAVRISVDHDYEESSTVVRLYLRENIPRALGTAGMCVFETTFVYSRLVAVDSAIHNDHERRMASRLCICVFTRMLAVANAQEYIVFGRHSPRRCRSVLSDRSVNEAVVIPGMFSIFRPREELGLRLRVNGVSVRGSSVRECDKRRGEYHLYPSLSAVNITTFIGPFSMRMWTSRSRRNTDSAVEIGQRLLRIYSEKQKPDADTSQKESFADYDTTTGAESAVTENLLGDGSRAVRRSDHSMRRIKAFADMQKIKRNRSRVSGGIIDSTIPESDDEDDEGECNPLCGERVTRVFYSCVAHTCSLGYRLLCCSWSNRRHDSKKVDVEMGGVSPNRAATGSTI